MPLGTTPQMMAQYWQRMQQFYTLMQQQMAAASTMSQMNAMTPAAMQQMQAIQQMQQMKTLQQQQQQQQMAAAGDEMDSNSLGHWRQRLAISECGFAHHRPLRLDGAMSGTHPIGGSSSNASQNQPANQSAGNVPGAFPGVPLRIPAGAPRPPFNQGIWEEQQDGSLIQITANYKGKPLRADRVCGNLNCGITRSREWRQVLDVWHCSACGNYLKRYKQHRVPPPESHITVPRAVASRDDAVVHATQSTFPAPQMLASALANTNMESSFSEPMDINRNSTSSHAQQQRQPNRLAKPRQATRQPYVLDDPLDLFSVPSTPEHQAPISSRAPAQSGPDHILARVTGQSNTAEASPSDDIITLTPEEHRLIQVSRMLKEEMDQSYVTIWEGMRLNDERIAQLVRSGRREDPRDDLFPLNLHPSDTLYEMDD